ncbi:MAG: anthranilate synthase component I family protein [Parvularculaceae bacterium]|nr:anthranilate synthase component I family protein [Parvularculaceae bacterium]
MIVTDLDWREPRSAFAPFARESGAVLLDAGDTAAGARWSFICVRPSAVIEYRKGQTLIDGARTDADPFAALAAMHDLRRRSHRSGPPLLSGLVGFVGYECGGLLEPRGEGPASSGLAPDFMFAAFDRVVAFDRLEKRVIISAPDRAGAQALENLLGVEQPARAAPALHFAGSNFSAPRYRDCVDEVIRRIRSGAAYQANISHRLHFKSDDVIDAFELYCRAAARSSAANAAYLNVGAAQIVSLSPERFFSISFEGETRVIRAEPIKGTRPRGVTPEADARLARELLESAKDRAENVMIADLMRNDLSRICRDGSIREEAICELMTLASVHHLVSRISGVLRDDVSPVHALTTLFPSGSITGAPKIEAMRAIAEIEGTARGAYCGAIGYIDDRGFADFSVAIRTATIEGRRVELPVGGGVTLRSNPEAEYEETLDKAAWFLDIAGVDRASIA